MNPQDDPEARIGDLERPLADVARASELGTPEHASGAYLPPPVTPPTEPYSAYGAYGAYGAPPPMPPPVQESGAYGSSYPDMYSYSGPPMKTKSNSAALWVVFGGIAVVMVLIGGGIVIWLNMFRLSSNTRPPINIPITPIEVPTAFPSAGPIPEIPIPQIPSGLPIPVPGGQVSVSGADKTETVSCNQSAVSISGVNNTVTITGHCVNVSVSGVDNDVILETADVISASGFDNRVTYKSGEPQITSSGSNVVERG